MSNLFVVAKLQAKAGKEDALEAELKKVIPEVRAEEGCIRYDLLRSVEDSCFLFYETWTGEDALASHLAAPHMEALRNAIADLLEGPPSIWQWNAVDEAR